MGDTAQTCRIRTVRHGVDDEDEILEVRCGIDLAVGRQRATHPLRPAGQPSDAARVDAIICRVDDEHLLCLVRYPVDLAVRREGAANPL